MENVPDQINQFKKLFREYFDANVEYFKLVGFEKLMRMVVALFFASVLLFVGLLALFFLGLGAAIWVGGLLENGVMGYMVMAAVFVFLFFMVYLLRRPLVERPLIKYFSFFLLQRKDKE
ncbi:MAG: hypothetical protein ACEPOZ_04435 [Marinifilaceae bacterium]